MAYHNLWSVEMILWIVIAIALAAIITTIFDYAFKPDHLSVDILVAVISLVLFGALPFIDYVNSSDVVLVSEKTHDVDKIIAENGLKVHTSTFYSMSPIREWIGFEDNTEIIYIEPDVKYVMYWTTGLGEKKMRAFEYIEKETANEKQTKANQADIDRYRLNSSVSENNP